MSLPTLDNENEKNKKNSGGLPSMPPLDESMGDTMPSLDSMPSLDEEFEEIPVDEALYGEEDETNEDLYEEDYGEREDLPDIVQAEKESIQEEDDYNPDYEEDLENTDEDKFIDKKKKRLIPFGGKKSKRNFVKSSDFDDRKNALAKTKITQFSIIAIILLMFLIGLKNTFMPSHVYTDTQIRQFAAEGAGQTGFPQERGRFFVENFMDAYLTLDKSDPTVLQSLSHYYGKESFSNSSYSGLNMDWNGEVKQEVVIKPKVHEIRLLTDYSAQYKVSAFVRDVDESEEGLEEGRWLNFSVNLYYDEEYDTLAITQDSPSIIPLTGVMEQKDVPNRAKLGNGNVNKEAHKEMSPTIDGFIEAFAKSSIASHNPVLQYIDDKNDIKLYDGFGGAVELNGHPDDSIKKTVYDVDGAGNYEVDLTVKWIDKKASYDGKLIEYTSRYQMGVRTDSEGKFVVTYFKPYEFYK